MSLIKTTSMHGLDIIRRTEFGKFSVLIALGSTHAASVAGAPEETYKSYKNYKVFSVSGDRHKLVDLASFLAQYDTSLGPHKFGSLIVDDYKKNLDVMVAPTVLKVYRDAVEARQLTSTLVYDDFSKIISLEKAQAQRSSGFSWTAYHDIDVINGYLKNMSALYPDVAKLVVGGRSYEGRPILGLRIVTPSENGNMKPAIIIESGIHAREWIAPATTTYFINQLLTSNDTNLRQLRDTFDWHIFPSANPDGYHYTHTTDRMWRKTRSRTSLFCYGVDANRNWDYNWNTAGTSADPCNYQIYGGPKAFSEKETSSFAKYIASIDNLLVYIAFHSYGQYLLIPLSDSTDHVDNYDDLVTIGKESLEYGAKASGLDDYTPPATAAEVLYKASGSSMDWVRSYLGTQLVYTYELRGRNFHWPAHRIPDQGNEVTQMVLGLCVKAKEMGYY